MFFHTADYEQLTVDNIEKHVFTMVSEMGKRWNGTTYVTQYLINPVIITEVCSQSIIALEIYHCAFGKTNVYSGRHKKRHTVCYKNIIDIDFNKFENQSIIYALSHGSIQHIDSKKLDKNDLTLDLIDKNRTEFVQIIKQKLDIYTAFVPVSLPKTKAIRL